MIGWEGPMRLFLLCFLIGCGDSGDNGGECEAGAARPTIDTVPYYDACSGTCPAPYECNLTIHRCE